MRRILRLIYLGMFHYRPGHIWVVLGGYKVSVCLDDGQATIFYTHEGPALRDRDDLFTVRHLGNLFGKFIERTSHGYYPIKVWAVKIGCQVFTMDMYKREARRYWLARSVHPRSN